MTIGPSHPDRVQGNGDTVAELHPPVVTEHPAPGTRHFESFSGPSCLAGFITGMSRAGTQWMCKCLNEHSQAAAFGESMFFGRRYVPPAPDGLYHAAQYCELRRHLLADGSCIHSTAGGGPGSLKRLTLRDIGPLVERLFPDDAPPMTPGACFRRLARAIAEAEGKPLAIEKTPHHLNWIDRILAHLPEARFVVMVREPYSFMLSYKHQGDRKAERVRIAFARRYHPLAAALIWRASIRTAADVATRHPDRSLVTPFDLLRVDAAGTLERVQRFLGLPVEPIAERVPPDNTSFPGGVRPHLQPEDLFWMRLIAGRAMRTHGFTPRPTPFAPLRIAWSMLRLPWWAVRNYLDLRSRVGGSTLGYLWRWLKPGRSARDETRASPPRSPASPTESSP